MINLQINLLFKINRLTVILNLVIIRVNAIIIFIQYYPSKILRIKLYEINIRNPNFDCSNYIILK